MACSLSGEGSGESDPGSCGRLASIADGPGVEEDGGVLRGRLSGRANSNPSEGQNTSENLGDMGDCVSAFVEALT